MAWRIVMETVFATLVDKCMRALESADAQRNVERILFEAASDPAVAAAIAQRGKFESLEDLAIHRSETLTLLAGSLPPGFKAAPHNHNLWSVVGVCSGQEDNQFFARDGNGLRQIGATSIVGPGVLANDAEVIHAIHNPLDQQLVILHAYGGDLFATPRSNWDPDTYEEFPYDWSKVHSN
jgi:predicted metal-dependent enzyme (double-stranded beta helix superfamily)